MIIQTTRFGEINIENQEIICFSNGIPGFPSLQKYTLIIIENSPFYFLQSVENGSLAFIMVSPFEFYPMYEFELSSSVLFELGNPKIDEIRVLNIATVPDSLKDATVNLIAPIVWNATTRRAAQVILQDTVYHTKHPLFSNSANSFGEEE